MFHKTYQRVGHLTNSRLLSELHVSLGRKVDLSFCDRNPRKLKNLVPASELVILNLGYSLRSSDRFNSDSQAPHSLSLI